MESALDGRVTGELAVWGEGIEMATYEVRTRLGADEALERADAFFGEGGLGLSPREEGPRSRTWQGGGGAVFLTVHDADGGSVVELATTEWDAQVREFMAELPKKWFG